APFLKSILEKCSPEGSLYEMHRMAQGEPSSVPESKSEGLVFARGHEPPVSSAVGPYRLDADVNEYSGLVEFSESEYKAMDSALGYETIFKAPPVRFLNFDWELDVGCV